MGTITHNAVEEVVSNFFEAWSKGDRNNILEQNSIIRSKKLPVLFTTFCYFSKKWEGNFLFFLYGSDAVILLLQSSPSLSFSVRLKRQLHRNLRCLLGDFDSPKISTWTRTENCSKENFYLSLLVRTICTPVLYCHRQGCPLSFVDLLK